MSATLGAALALGAAATTALAHGLIKSGGDTLATRAAVGLTQSALAIPLVLVVGWPDAALWPWLALSIATHVVYQLVLNRAYERADFSVAFPLARGVAPIATALLGVVLLAETPGLLTLAGILIVSLGLALIAFRGGMTGDALIAAAVAGLLTSAYTLIDAQGVRTGADPLDFIAWFFLLEAFGLLPIYLMLKRRAAVPLLLANARRGMIAGTATVIGFGAALWALSLASAGAVSALRETSVVLALAFGAVVLRERMTAQRILGGGLVAAGAVLVVIGGA